MPLCYFFLPRREGGCRKYRVIRLNAGGSAPTPPLLRRAFFFFFFPAGGRSTDVSAGSTSRRCQLGARSCQLLRFSTTFEAAKLEGVRRLHTCLACTCTPGAHEHAVEGFVARSVCSICRAPHPLAHRSRRMPNSKGPSAEARQRATLKRQRKAGTVLDGAAARAASAKKAAFRGSTPPQDVGRPGQPYYHSAPLPPLPQALPALLELSTAKSGDEAATMVRAYASEMAALEDVDWTQDLATACAAKVTHAACVKELSPPALAGLVAADVGAHSVTIRVLHVVPRHRGHARLGEHLWRALLPQLQEATRTRSKHRRTCYLNTTCTRGPQAAAFWIERCGWKGSDDATDGARRWHTQGSVATSKKTKVGEYQMFYEL